MKTGKRLVDDYDFLLAPLFFGLFPLLSFYGANESEIQSGDFSITPFVIFNLSVTVAVWTVGWLITRDKIKASVLAVPSLTVFFLFGRFSPAIIKAQDKLPNLPFGLVKGAFVGCLMLLGLWAWRVRRQSSQRASAINRMFIYVGAALMVTTLPSIVASTISSSNSQSQATSPQVIVDNEAMAIADQPDIYYILLDGYGRADQLSQRFDYDNSAFLNDLIERGFYVADQSNSNYAHTHLSVPSTFNMRYLDDLTQQIGEDSQDRSPLKKLTLYNETSKILEQAGYKYVSLGTQWDWTVESRTSNLSDVSLGSNASSLLGIKLDEFARVYLQTTALKPFVSAKIRNELVNRTLGAFEKTKQIAKLDDKTITFTHIVSPHPPYLFDEKGVIANQNQLDLDNQGFSDRQKFLDQTTYINKLTTELVDAILQNSSKPPVIVIASDHGPSTGLPSRQTKALGKGEKLSDSDIAALKLRMANLNAYYFPDKKYDQLYPSITPVNTFRTILRKFFGQKIENLPDRVYFSDNQDQEYKFFDVTDLVNPIATSDQ